MTGEYTYSIKSETLLFFLIILSFNETLWDISRLNL